MKFTSLELAQAFCNRAFENCNRHYTILHYDFPYYYVCTWKEASKLMKQGYELAPRW